jgi:cell division septal protein FtsQ
MNLDKSQTPKHSHEGKIRRNKYAYRDGSLHNKSFDDEFFQENPQILAQKRMVRRMILGSLSAAIMILGGGIFFLFTYLTQPSTSPVETVPVPANRSNSSQ